MQEGIHFCQGDGGAWGVGADLVVCQLSGLDFGQFYALQMAKNTYIDYASIAQTAPVQPSEQVHHRIVVITGQSPKRIPRPLQSRLLNTSRLKRRSLFKRRAKGTTIALGIRSPTTLLRSMRHLQCRRCYSPSEEQRSI